MAITKPPVDSIIWGSGATSSPDMVTPGAGMFSSGFVAPPTKPTRGHMNFLLNKLHSAIRYFSSRGIPDWDAAETQYVVGSVVFYATTGKFYRCFNAAVTGSAPSVDTTHWKDLFLIPGLSLRRSILPGTGTLAPIAGCSLARIRIIGGGGGSQGAWGGSGIYQGAGGGSGSFGEWEITNIPGGTWSWTAGAAGAAAAAPGSVTSFTDGGDGGNSTFGDGTNTYTAPGGKGGTFLGSSPAAASITAGPGTGATGFGVVGVPGGPGGAWDPGSGGAYTGTAYGGYVTPYGSGGRARAGGDYGDGRVGSGYGSGASGAMADGSAPRAGAAGTSGVIFLEEFA